mmetsp:Transcript_107466/g.347121  ORF Transcript_107466/g.347121 Transcript_107466/m.347121 type:complete len:229 (+) Transcript_107466:52-738(+)
MALAARPDPSFVPSVPVSRASSRRSTPAVSRVGTPFSRLATPWVARLATPSDCSSYGDVPGFRVMMPTPPASRPMSGAVSSASASRQATPAMVRLGQSNSVPELQLPSISEGAQDQRVAHFITDVTSGDMQRSSSLAEVLAKMKKVKKDHSAHLRRHPMNMCMPPQLTSSYTAGMAEPMAKMMDPKWSTELREMDRKMGEKNKYDVRLTASITGGISPEPAFFPKRHL